MQRAFRKIVWTLVILGPLLWHGWGGILLNVPGWLMLLGLGKVAWTYTWWGRVLCAALTLAACEPLLRWLERPAAVPQQGGMSRRAFLVTTGGATTAALAGGYAGLYEPYHCRLEQHVLGLRDLPAELEGLRVVVMSDWHCGPFHRPAQLAKVMQLANSCRPDLILLPGDFLSRSSRYWPEAAELAALLRPRIPGGVFLSWGNHDYRHGIEPGLELMPAAGCQILTNRRMVLTPRRDLQQEGRGLWICGLDDLWEGQPQLGQTLAGLPEDQPRLVLSHNPDVAEEQIGPRVDLMLSGHTHGGQVRIPEFGPPVIPSKYGKKYASGWCEGPGYQVYVGRGVGTSGLPVRCGVPPEVTCFHLQRKV